MQFQKFISQNILYQSFTINFRFSCSIKVNFIIFTSILLKIPSQSIFVLFFIDTQLLHQSDILTGKGYLRLSEESRILEEFRKLKKYKFLFTCWADIIQTISMKTSFGVKGEGQFPHWDKPSFPWNDEQPCTDRNIQEFAIRYLPGNEVVLGKNLGILCIVQAAEIQRLTRSLQEYKNKLLELEKVSYCRDSYETQIKELTERLRKAEQKQKNFLQSINVTGNGYIQNSREIASQKKLIGVQSLESVQEMISKLLMENSQLKKNSQMKSQKTQDLENLQIKLIKQKPKENKERKVSEFVMGLDVGNEVSQMYKKTSIQEKVGEEEDQLEQYSQRKTSRSIDEENYIKSKRSSLQVKRQFINQKNGMNSEMASTSISYNGINRQSSILDQIKIQQLKKEIQHLKEENQVMKMKVNNKQQKEKKKLKKILDENDKQKLKLSENQRIIEDMRENLIKREQRISSLERQQLKLKREKEEEIENMQQQMKNLEEEVEKKIKKQENLEKRLKMIQIQGKKKENSMSEEIEKRIKIEKEKEEEIESQGKKIGEMKNVIGGLRKLVQENKKVIITEKIKANKIEKQLKSLKNYCDELGEDIEEKEEYIEQLEKRIVIEKLQKKRKEESKNMMIDAHIETEMLGEVKDEVYEEEIKDLTNKLEEIQNRMNEAIQQKDAEIKEIFEKKDAEIKEIFENKDAEIKEIFEKKDAEIKEIFEKKDAEIKDISEQRDLLVQEAQVQFIQPEVEHIRPIPVQSIPSFEQLPSQKIVDLENENQALRKEIENILEQLKVEKVKSSKFESEANSLKNYNEELEEEMGEMEDEIEKLMEENEVQEQQDVVRTQKVNVNKKMMIDAHIETEMLGEVKDEVYEEEIKDLTNKLEEIQNRMNEAIQQKDAEIKEIFEKKDAEIKEIFEKKDAEIKEISEKKDAEIKEISEQRDLLVQEAQVQFIQPEVEHIRPIPVQSIPSFEQLPSQKIVDLENENQALRKEIENILEQLKVEKVKSSKFESEANSLKNYNEELEEEMGEMEDEIEKLMEENEVQEQQDVVRTQKVNVNKKMMIDAHIETEMLGEVKDEVYEEEIKDLTNKLEEIQNRMNEAIQQKDAEIKEIFEKKDAEIKEIFEKKDAEIKEIFEKKDAEIKEIFEKKDAEIKEISEKKDAEIKEISEQRDLLVQEAQVQFIQPEVEHIRPIPVQSIPSFEQLPSQKIVDLENENQALRKEIENILEQLKVEKVKSSKFESEANSLKNYNEELEEEMGEMEDAIEKLMEENEVQEQQDVVRTQKVNVNKKMMIDAHIETEMLGEVKDEVYEEEIKDLTNKLEEIQNRMNEAIQQKDAEIKEIFEKKDAEIKEIFEKKDAEIKEISEKKDAEIKEISEQRDLLVQEAQVQFIQPEVEHIRPIPVQSIPSFEQLPSQKIVDLENENQALRKEIENILEQLKVEKVKSSKFESEANSLKNYNEELEEEMGEMEDAIEKLMEENEVQEQQDVVRTQKVNVNKKMMIDAHIETEMLGEVKDEVYEEEIKDLTNKLEEIQNRMNEAIQQKDAEIKEIFEKKDAEIKDISEQRDLLVQEAQVQFIQPEVEHIRPIPVQSIPSFEQLPSQKIVDLENENQALRKEIENILERLKVEKVKSSKFESEANSLKNYNEELEEEMGEMEDAIEKLMEENEVQEQQDVVRTQKVNVNKKMMIDAHIETEMLGEVKDEVYEEEIKDLTNKLEEIQNRMNEAIQQKDAEIKEIFEKKDAEIKEIFEKKDAEIKDISEQRDLLVQEAQVQFIQPEVEHIRPIPVQSIPSFEQLPSQKIVDLENENQALRKEIENILEQLKVEKVKSSKFESEANSLKNYNEELEEEMGEMEDAIEKLMEENEVQEQQDVVRTQKVNVNKKMMIDAHIETEMLGEVKDEVYEEEIKDLTNKLEEIQNRMNEAIQQKDAEIKEIFEKKDAEIKEIFEKKDAEIKEISEQRDLLVQEAQVQFIQPEVEHIRPIPVQSIPSFEQLPSQKMVDLENENQALRKEIENILEQLKVEKVKSSKFESEANSLKNYNEELEEEMGEMEDAIEKLMEENEVQEQQDVVRTQKVNVNKKMMIDAHIETEMLGEVKDEVYEEEIKDLTNKLEEIQNRMNEAIQQKDAEIKEIFEKKDAEIKDISEQRDLLVQEAQVQFIQPEVEHIRPIPVQSIPSFEQLPSQKIVDLENENQALRKEIENILEQLKVEKVKSSKFESEANSLKNYNEELEEEMGEMEDAIEKLMEENEVQEQQDVVRTQKVNVNKKMMIDAHIETEMLGEVKEEVYEEEIKDLTNKLEEIQNRMNEAIQQKDAEIKEIFEKKDAEIKEISEQRDLLVQEAQVQFIQPEVEHIRPIPVQSIPSFEQLPSQKIVDLENENQALRKEIENILEQLKVEKVKSSKFESEANSLKNYNEELEEEMEEMEDAIEKLMEENEVQEQQDVVRTQKVNVNKKMMIDAHIETEMLGEVKDEVYEEEIKDLTNKLEEIQNRMNEAIQQKDAEIKEIFEKKDAEIKEIFEKKDAEIKEIFEKKDAEIKEIFEKKHAEIKDISEQRDLLVQEAQVQFIQPEVEHIRPIPVQSIPSFEQLPSQKMVDLENENQALRKEIENILEQLKVEKVKSSKFESEANSLKNYNEELEEEMGEMEDAIEKLMEENEVQEQQDVVRTQKVNVNKKMMIDAHIETEMLGEVKDEVYEEEIKDLTNKLEEIQNRMNEAIQQKDAEIKEIFEKKDAEIKEIFEKKDAEIKEIFEKKDAEIKEIFEKKDAEIKDISEQRDLLVQEAQVQFIQPEVEHIRPIPVQSIPSFEQLPSQKIVDLENENQALRKEIENILEQLKVEKVKSSKFESEANSLKNYNEELEEEMGEMEDAIEKLMEENEVQEQQDVVRTQKVNVNKKMMIDAHIETEMLGEVKDEVYEEEIKDLTNKLEEIQNRMNEAIQQKDAEIKEIFEKKDAEIKEIFEKKDAEIKEIFEKKDAEIKDISEQRDLLVQEAQVQFIQPEVEHIRPIPVQSIPSFEQLPSQKIVDLENENQALRKEIENILEQLKVEKVKSSKFESEANSLKNYNEELEEEMGEMEDAIEKLMEENEVQEQQDVVRTQKVNVNKKMMIDAHIETEMLGEVKDEVYEEEIKDLTNKLEEIQNRMNEAIQQKDAEIKEIFEKKDAEIKEIFEKKDAEIKEIFEKKDAEIKEIFEKKDAEIKDISEQRDLLVQEAQVQFIQPEVEHIRPIPVQSIPSFEQLPSQKMVDLENENQALRKEIENILEQLKVEKVKSSKFESEANSLKNYNEELEEEMGEMEDAIEKLMEENEVQEQQDVVRTQKVNVNKKMMIDAHIETEMLGEVKDEVYEEEIKDLTNKLEEIQNRMNEAIQQKDAEIKEIFEKKDAEIKEIFEKKDAEIKDIFEKKDAEIKEIFEKKDAEIKDISEQRDLLVQEAQVQFIQPEVEHIRPIPVQSIPSFEQLPSQKIVDLENENQALRKEIENILEQLKVEKVKSSKFESEANYLKNYNEELEEEMGEMEDAIEKLMEENEVQEQQDVVRTQKVNVNKKMMIDASAQVNLLQSLIQQSLTSSLLALQDYLQQTKAHFATELQTLSTQYDELITENTSLRQLLTRVQEKNLILQQSFKLKYNQMVTQFQSELSELQNRQSHLILLNQAQTKQIQGYKMQLFNIQRIPALISMNQQQEPASEQSNCPSSLDEKQERIQYILQPVCVKNEDLFEKAKSQQSIGKFSSEPELQKLKEINETLKDNLNTKNDQLSELTTLHQNTIQNLETHICENKLLSAKFEEVMEQKRDLIRSLEQLQRQFAQKQIQSQRTLKKLREKQSEWEYQMNQIKMQKEYIQEQQTNLENKVKWYDEQLESAQIKSSQKINKITETLKTTVEQSEKSKEQFLSEIQKLNNQIFEKNSENDLLIQKYESQILQSEQYANKKQEEISTFKIGQNIFKTMITNLEIGKQQLLTRVNECEIKMKETQEEINRSEKERLSLMNEIKYFQIEMREYAMKKLIAEVEEEEANETTLTKILNQPVEKINQSDLCQSLKLMKNSLTNSINTMFETKQRCINRLQQSIYEKDNENKIMKKKEEEWRNIDQQSHNFERGIFLLEEEMDRLQDNLLYEKNRNDDLQAQKEEVENQNQNNIRKARNFESELIETKKRIFSTETKISSMENENKNLKSDNNELHQKIQKLDKEMILGREEIDRLREFLSRSSSDLHIEKQRAKSLTKQNQLLKKKLDEEQTNPFFERQHYKTYYHSMTSEKEQTIKKKNNSYEELCRLVAEYESQIKEAEQEIDKAKLMIEMKDDEINKLVYELKREKRKSQREQSKFVSTNNHRMEELRIAKKALAEYEVRITALFDEFDRLQKIIDSLKKEKTEHINKNNGMFRECKMMENKNNALKYQIENLQMDLADKINLENKYEEMLAKHTIQCALVESQQKRINEKEMEIGILKNMIPSSYRV